jgi:hypothetical protein
MNKTDFLKVCEQHQINPKALKRKMNEDGISRKYAFLYDVLKCAMIHAPDLMFCRQSDYENEVEYFDKHAPSRLIDAMLEAQKEVQNG